jgi:NAD(P)H-nitrite reductase large subunit
MDETKSILCRCEDISVQDVRDAIDSGCRTVDEIKRLLRCGMGPCQGRTCGFLIARELSRLTGQPIDEKLWRPSMRPPVGGVTFEEILGGSDEE